MLAGVGTALTGTLAGCGGRSSLSGEATVEYDEGGEDSYNGAAVHTEPNHATQK